MFLSGYYVWWYDGCYGGHYMVIIYGYYDGYYCYVIIILWSFKQDEFVRLILIGGLLVVLTADMLFLSQLLDFCPRFFFPHGARLRNYLRA